ncbi:MAG TPA: magnesium chelatase, partial [Acidimicrobiales bacterium]|nr:magnesium chelatase [Acidimicrobiales bacterium]
THYPPDTETELAIVKQEARVPEVSATGPTADVPDFMAEVVAELSQLARQSPHINQHSGVSVRLSISNYETLIANATRRALRLGEPEAVPRVSDLAALVSSTHGKVEIEALEEGREDRILQALVSAAVLAVFRDRVPTEGLGPVVAAFDDKKVVHAGDDLPASSYVSMVSDIPGLEKLVLGLAGGEAPGRVASAAEFILEGLHLTKRLNKEAAGAKATYRGRG